jgi:acetolactate synthase-1/3 small subunit
MRHVISALVMNEPGVLANVAGMFAARGFNIDSLVVGRTENPELSRMTIVVTPMRTRWSKSASNWPSWCRS